MTIPRSPIVNPFRRPADFCLPNRPKPPVLLRQALPRLGLRVPPGTERHRFAHPPPASVDVIMNMDRDAAGKALYEERSKLLGGLGMPGAQPWEELPEDVKERWRKHAESD